jgi:ATP-dependent DNA helicase RecG
MQGKKDLLDVPVRFIKGVGPRKAVLFEKLGIYSVQDLFDHLPRRYEDRSGVVPVRELEPGRTAMVAVKVVKTSTFRARTGTAISQVSVKDGSGRLTAVWYNQPYMGRVFKPGQTVVFYGRPEVRRSLQMAHPAYEIVAEPGEKPDIEKVLKSSVDIGRIVPFYPLTADLSQKLVRRAMFGALGRYAGYLDEVLPTNIRARRKLVDIRFAVNNIHFPLSMDNLQRAYRRIVFQEFFLLQVVMALRRRGVVSGRGRVQRTDRNVVDEFRDIFDFELTGGQKACMDDIARDMASESAMHRLLQGDVGSGKTVVAMFAAMVTVRNGLQAAVMVPTEILARQHFVNFSKAFMPLGMNMRLLVNGISEGSRDEILREIRSGEADIVVGTHSLIRGQVDFRDLGLVVVDEQHKFGVDQRGSLKNKGHNVDTLVMTATPIPRSLALTLYGDMDVSMLREKPRSGTEVTTYFVGEDKRSSVYGLVRDELNSGRQAFFVCPRVSGDPDSALKSAGELHEELDEKVFPEFRIGLVHGRMKARQKDAVMEAFRDGKFDVLVATTVIEVGVDIPNVTVMVVEHAERYGLAQLHQLRGRIGRGKHDSYCVLIGDASTEAAYERLSTMSGTTDGFEIAEKDLDIRGPGEFLGARQSGLPELKAGNIVRDMSIMKEAREEAFGVVRSDPGLSGRRNRMINTAVRRRFGVDPADIS